MSAHILMAGDPASRASHETHNPVNRACGLSVASVAHAEDGEAFNVSANAARGEAMITVAGEQWLLRPTFTALVAVEEELGSLFALVERAAAGGLKLTELVALFWQCCVVRDGVKPSREQIGEAITGQGLAAVTPQLRLLLEAVLKGG